MVKKRVFDRNRQSKSLHQKYKFRMTSSNLIETLSKRAYHSAQRCHSRTNANYHSVINTKYL